MSIPIYLSGAGKVMGVVNITERKSDRPFSETEAEFVSHLARQAAFALMNAALWKKRKKK
jgi:GAF domain-containing protein